MLVYAASLALGIVAAFGAGLLSRGGGLAVLVQAPLQVCFYLASLAALRRRSLPGRAVIFAFGGALTGIIEILGRQIHGALRVPTSFQAGSASEQLALDRVWEVILVWTFAQALVFVLLTGALLAQSRARATAAAAEPADSLRPSGVT